MFYGNSNKYTVNKNISYCVHNKYYDCSISILLVGIRRIRALLIVMQLYTNIIFFCQMMR